MISRKLLKSAAAFAFCLAATGCSKDEASDDSLSAEPPAEPALPAGDGNGLNLLLLSVDTLRADHLGAYGYGPPTSPMIDRLAETGTLFEQAYAPRGLTWPSLVSLMTSRYPVQHGVRTNAMKVDESELTLAEILRDKGYASAAYIAPTAIDQFWEGFETVELADDPAISRQGVEWLEGAGDGPFFLWLHYFGPHKPYTPPEEYAMRFSRNYTGPFKGLDGHMNAITAHQTELGPEDLDHLIGLYDALIARTDDLLQEVLASLESLGLAEKTLVVFISDHGEDLYDHNKYFFHFASVYDSSLHIPLIFRLPGVVPEGLRVGPLVETNDISPTILQLLGFSTAPSFEGTSLAPFFDGEGPELGPAFAEWRDMILTVRTENYRYVSNPAGLGPVWLSPEGFAKLRKQEFYQRMVEAKVLDPRIEQLDYPIGETELYDVGRDPLQMIDNLGAYAGPVAELTGLLQDWQRKYGWEWMGGIDQIDDPELRKRLEALGYVF